jgi:hypothetical protein
VVAPPAADEQNGTQHAFDRTTITLVVVGVLGIGAVVAGNVASMSHTIKDLFVTGGESLLIAALLGLTVDVFFKRELVRDAFSASFGYCLPEAIRAEARWILGQQLICISHDQHFKLREHPGSERLRLEVEVWRKITNVGDRRVQYAPSFGVDEWFHDEPSAIETVEAFRGEKRISQLSADEAKATAPVKNGCITRVADELWLEPGETIALHYLAHETRLRSEAYSQTIMQPTTQPTISVDCDRGVDLNFDVHFGNRGSVLKMGSHWHLQATLLPYQVITLRWWPKDVADRSDGVKVPEQAELAAEAIREADAAAAGPNGGPAPVAS